MKPASKPILLLLIISTLAISGCQTWSLTDEQFEKQRHGEQVDPETGAAVGCIGTAVYFGAWIGALVAGVR